MCMIDDADPWDFFTEAQRRAAKAHRCGECRRVIAKGETYRYCSGKVMDGIETMRQCLQCEAATQWLRVACNGYLFGCVEEDLENHVIGYECDLRTRPLTRLLRWMRADWRDRAGNLRPLGDVEALTAEAIAAYRVQYAASGAA